MILTDAGPLVAFLDTDDPNHSACMITAQSLPAEPMLTTWPCFAEAMYLLGAVGGHLYQAELWQLWKTGRLLLHDLLLAEVQHMLALMEKYRDTPMDLADASLLVVAESLSLRRIFSIDRETEIFISTVWRTARLLR
ncbi:MAG: type II toxin-antitoxin system VapC family toxin [Chloroflexia bacterium]